MAFMEGASPPCTLAVRATRIASHHIARHTSMRSSTRAFQRATAHMQGIATRHARQPGTSCLRERRPDTCADNPPHIMHFARTTLPQPMHAAPRIKLALAASYRPVKLMITSSVPLALSTRHMCSSRLDLHPRRRRIGLGVSCTCTSRLWLSDRSSEELSDDRAQPASTLCMGALEWEARCRLLMTRGY